MNRQGFIASCAELSEQELLSIALESRKMAASRVPPEVQIKFRSLDGVTEAKELWEPTAFGKTHLFIVREKDFTGPLPVVVNIHGGGWSLDHTERDTYFCRRLAARLHCLVVDVDYGTEILAKQTAELKNIRDFVPEVYSCRTFVFLHELQFLIQNNLAHGGDLDNAIVFVAQMPSPEVLAKLGEFFHKSDLKVTENGILNNIDLRFPNEPARHKLLDLVGDLYLLGKPIKGHVFATRPGHFANTELVKKLTGCH